jgi:uncharacterized Fe-S cluster-containing radical SAM superfamily protein
MPQHLDRPFSVWFQPTKTCNLNCALCYDDCGRDFGRPELGYDEIVRIIDELTDEGVIAVAFEGGEPLVRPDFMDILRHTCAKAFVLVRTNATLITEDVARQFKAVGVGTVIVDLWGATAATHDRLTGTPGSFEQALAGARAVIDQGIIVFLTCIMTRQNHQVELGGPWSTWGGSPFVLDLLSPVAADPAAYGIRLRSPAPQEDLALTSDYDVVAGLTLRQAAKVADVAAGALTATSHDRPPAFHDRGTYVGVAEEFAF